MTAFTKTLLRSAWSGVVSIEYKSMQENRIGINCILTTIDQIAAVNNVIYMAKIAFSNLASIFSRRDALIAQSVLYLTPVIFNIVNCRYNRRKIEDFPKGFDPVKSICLVAVMVSSIALIALGQHLMGGATLAWIFIGLIQRGCEIPEAINSSINRLGFFGINMARLALGNILLKLLAIYEIGEYIYTAFASDKKQQSPSSDKFLDDFSKYFNLGLNELDCLIKKMFLPSFQAEKC